MNENRVKFSLECVIYNRISDPERKDKWRYFFACNSEHGDSQDLYITEDV